MMILDTNVISECMRSRPAPRVMAWLASQPSSAVFLTAVTTAELQYGAAILPEGRRREQVQRAIQGMIDEDFVGRVLPFDGEAAQAYAEIASASRSAGRPISPFDCQIAAIARARGAVIATRNVEDFLNCGVEIINPWS